MTPFRGLRWWNFLPLPCLHPPSPGRILDYALITLLRAIPPVGFPGAAFIGLVGPPIALAIGVFPTPVTLRLVSVITVLPRPFGPLCTLGTLAVTVSLAGC